MTSEIGDVSTTNGGARKGHVQLEIEQRPFAFRTCWSVGVAARGKVFEQCATLLYKVLRAILPRKLVHKCCNACLKLAVFFLQLFEVFFYHCQASADKRKMLTKNGR